MLKVDFVRPMRSQQFAALFSPLLAALVLSAAQPQAAETEPLSVCEVLKDLQKWHGKTVRLKGTFAIGRHSAQFLDRACPGAKLQTGAPAATLREPAGDTARRLPPAAKARIDSFWSRLDRWENERESGGPLSLEIRLIVTGVLESTPGARHPAQITLTDVVMLD